MNWVHTFLLMSVLALESCVNAGVYQDAGSSNPDVGSPGPVFGTGCTFEESCIPTINARSVDTAAGFNVNVYSLTGPYFNANYMAYYYLFSPLIDSSTGVTSPNTVWNEGVQFVVQYIGYFVPPESGIYTLKAELPGETIGSVMVWLGSEMAFECCLQTIPGNSADGYLLFVTDNIPQQAYIHLDAAIYYPIRIVFGSEYPTAGVQMSMETPSDTQITDDWSPYIVQVPDFQDYECFPVPTTTSESTAGTLYWTGSNTFTSTYVFTTTDSSSVVHVVTESAEVVPAPPVFTTDVLSTTTVVTEYTAIDTTLGATPYVTTGNVVLVPSFVASTTSESTAGTLYWTGSNTFTSTYVFTTTDSSSVVHVVTESAEVVPEPPVFTTDVSSTTTVVTEFTAIDTTLGATPYVTTGNAVLVPRSSAGSDSTSNTTTSTTTSTSTSETTTSTSTSETTTATSTSETTTSGTTTSETTTSGTTTSETTTSGTTTSETTTSSTSETITPTTTPTTTPITTPITTPTTTSGEVGYGTYIWTGTSTTTLTLTYINDELYVPATGLYKRADSTSLSIVVLIPTPTYYAFTDGQSVVVLTIPELLPNGQTSTVPLTFRNTAYYPSVTTSNIIAPTNSYITITTTSTSLLPTTVTSIVTTTDAQGSTVTEAVVIIVDGTSLSTTTTIGTQATTFTSVYTGTDGKLTADIIVVQVPTDGTRTITVPGTTIYTITSLCTTTNAAGATLTITDVVVYCPEDNYHESHILTAHDTTVINEVTEVVTLSCTTYTDKHGKLTSYTTTVTDYVVVPKTLIGPTTYAYSVGSLKPADASHSAPQPSGPVKATFEGLGNSLQVLGMGTAAAAMLAFALV